MKLLVNNYTSQIVYDIESEATQKAFDTLVYETINILDPNRFMAPAFKRKYWDGRISVYNQKTHTFPTGLSRYFINLFNTQYAKYPNMVLDIIDNRSDSVRAEVPDIIKLGNGEEPDITLRDYQAEAVKKSYDKQVGIVHLSTNSGKTEVASGIIKLAENAIDDDNRIFFMCGSKDIAYQSQARISKRLGGVHVGFWGDGKYDEAQIMVVMVGTVNSALKKPEDVVKLTNNKDKALKKFVTEIYPKLTDKPSIKTTARMLAKNFRVKYKYDEQVLDMIVQIATTSESSNDKHQKALDFWVNKYDKLMQKKGGKVYDKYNNAIELLNSVKICITDECLTGDTLISMNDGSQKPIKDVVIGDVLADNNTVTHKKVTDKQPVVTVTHKYGNIKGSETHPLAVLDKGEIKYKPIMLLQEGDRLLIPRLSSKNQTNPTRTMSMRVSPIKSIERTDEEAILYDLTTENHTFIANSLLSHNCHHSTASTYINVYENMPNARMRIGLTGTVDKKDAIQWWKLQANFVDVISTVRNKEMIDRGVSAKPTVKLLPIEYPQVPQLAQMATQALNPNIPKSQAKLMEYQFIYKEGIINNDYRNQLIVALAERLESQEGTTLIVVNSVEHGELIQEKLKESGVTSAFLQGANSTNERNDILDGVKSGKVKTLIGTQLIDEGIDLPNLSYLLYTAGGKSPRQLLQRIGRVLRISDTKKTATIIDFQDRTHPVFSKQADARKRIYLDEQFTIEGD